MRRSEPLDEVIVIVGPPPSGGGRNSLSRKINKARCVPTGPRMTFVSYGFKRRVSRATPADHDHAREREQPCRWAGTMP